MTTDARGSHFDTGYGGRLSIGGGLVNPRLVIWRGGVAYQGLQGMGVQGRTWSNELGLDADLTFGSGLPVTLVVGLARTGFERIMIVGAAPTPLTGIMTRLRGGAVFNVAGAPRITLSVTRTWNEQEPLTPERRFVGDTMLSALAQQVAGSATGRATYSVGYQGNWVNGPVEQDAFSTHNVNVDAQGTLGEVSAHARESYFIRFPQLANPGGVRIDANEFLLGLSYLRNPGNVGARLDYQYTTLSFEVPGIPVAAQRQHLLAQRAHYRPSQSVMFQGGLLVSNSLQAVGPTTQSGWTEALELNGSWNRPLGWLSLSADLGGRGGLTQPDSGGLRFNYGVAARVNANAASPLGFARVTYDFGYDSGEIAVAGFRFRQDLVAEASLSLGVGRFLSAMFRAGSARREDLVGGTFLSRGLAASLDYRSRDFGVGLWGELTDGVGAGLISPGIGGGLFLPAVYNTNQRSLRLRATANRVAEILTVALDAQVGDSSGPGVQPNLRVLGNATVSTYLFRRIQLSLQDSVEYSNLNGIGVTVNRVMLQVGGGFGTELFGS